MRSLLYVTVSVLAVLAGFGHAQGEDIDVFPGNIGAGSLSVTGTGWINTAAWLAPDGYDFATNRHSYNLTSGPVALQGFVNVAQAAQVNPNDWSKYYAKFSIRDNSDKTVEVVFGNDWLGSWHGIAAQGWDRIRLENNMGLTQPSQYYCTEGGTHDMGGGGPVYPSDQNYYMQLVADSVAKTFTLQVYGKGSSAPITTGWPAQNTLDAASWLTIGSINVGDNFNFAAVEFYSILWASTQAGSTEVSTVNWGAMNIGQPLDFSQAPVPEPATLSLLGLGAAALLRRRRA